MLIRSPLNRYSEDFLPSERYEWLRNNWHSDRFCINYAAFLGQIPQQIENKFSINSECITWTNWVNTKIVLNLGIADYKTINVLLRIATGMLDKISCLTKSEKIEIHRLLTSNIQDELGIIWTESLPF